MGILYLGGPHCPLLLALSYEVGTAQWGRMTDRVQPGSQTHVDFK